MLRGGGLMGWGVVGGGVAQTSIRAEGFRSLREGEEVEFDVDPGEDGRHKAVNVTGPGGAAPLVSPPPSSAHSCAPSMPPCCSPELAETRAGGFRQPGEWDHGRQP